MSTTYRYLCYTHYKKAKATTKLNLTVLSTQESNFPNSAASSFVISQLLIIGEIEMGNVLGQYLEKRLSSLARCFFRNIISFRTLSVIEILDKI